MIYLVSHIVLLSGFGLLLKDAKNRGHRLNPIGLVNYSTAFILACFLAFQEGNLGFTRLTFAFGLANGASYSLGFVLVVAGIRMIGIIVTTAAIRLSMIIPIILSVFFWNERVNFYQKIGILTALVALPLLAMKTESTPTDDHTKERQKSKITFVIVALLFINSGVGHLAMKGFNEMCPIDQKPMYLVFLFLVTTIPYLFVCFGKRQLPNYIEFFYGILIGFCNITGSGMFLVALDHLPASVVFPVSSSGGMLFTTIVGVLVLGERFNKMMTLGVVLTSISLVLVNLGLG